MEMKVHIIMWPNLCSIR